MGAPLVIVGVIVAEIMDQLAAQAPQDGRYPLFRQRTPFLAVGNADRLILLLAG